MSLPENGYTQPVEIVVGGTLPRNGWVQPVEIVAGSGMAIGGTITGGTPGSVLFVGPGSVLAQNNSAFFWNNTSNFLRFGQLMGVQFTADPTAAPFSIHTSQTTFNGIITNDLHYAYNVQPGTSGTQVVLTEPTFRFMIEAHYFDGVTHWLEYDSNYVSADGLTIKRGWLYRVDRTTNIQTWGFSASYVAFYDDTFANSYGAFVSGGLVLGLNNIPASSPNLLRMLPNSNNTVLAGRAGDIFLQNTDATVNAYTLIQHSSSSGSAAAGVSFVNTNPASSFANIQIHGRGSLGGYAVRAEFGDQAITLTGNLLFPDASWSIGQAGTNRPNVIYWSSQLLAPDGSNTTPAYSFSAAANTGIYRAAGAINFTLGGAQTYEFSTAGLFILSNVAPIIVGASADTYLQRNSAGIFEIGVSANGVLAGYDGTNCLLKPSSGQLAFGTAALATNATTGFPCAQSSAGVPTGVPASIPTGQVPWQYDSTNDQVDFYNGSWKAIQAGQKIGCSFTATASVALNNSAAETSMIGTGVGTKAIAANTFTVGKTIRVKLAGFFTTGATPQTLTIKVKLGTTVLGTITGLAPIINASSLGWELEADITCRTTGGAGAFFAQARLIFDSTTLTAALVDFVVATATVAVDTTASQTPDVTFTTAAGDAAATYTCTNVIMETMGG